MIPLAIDLLPAVLKPGAVLQLIPPAGFIFSPAGKCRFVIPRAALRKIVTVLVRIFFHDTALIKEVPFTVCFLPTVCYGFSGLIRIGPAVILSFPLAGG